MELADAVRFARSRVGTVIAVIAFIAPEELRLGRRAPFAFVMLVGKKRAEVAIAAKYARYGRRTITTVRRKRIR